MSLGKEPKYVKKIPAHYDLHNPRRPNGLWRFWGDELSTER